MKSGRREPINPATITSALQIHLRMDVIGNGPRMLDRFAIHVEDVQRAVRGVDEIDRPKPGIGRGDEIHFVTVRAENVTPSAANVCTWTRLLATSPMKAAPRYFPDKRRRDRS